MLAASRPGPRWRRFCPSWRPAAASRLRSATTWPLFCRVLPTSPSSALLTLLPRRGLPGSSTSLFAFRRHLSPSCRLPWLPVTNSGSSFIPLLHHQIHSRNRWFPLTLTDEKRDSSKEMEILQDWAQWRMAILGHRLNPGGAVGVDYGWDAFPCARARFHCKTHEGALHLPLEIVLHVL